MSETNNRRAAGVGIFIAVGLLFLLGGILAIGNLHSTFSKKLSISTVFGEVNGLISGNNIWFSGVKIGTVKKLEFYGESQVKVIMNINVESRQYIRKDAKVKVGTDGLIGNKILIIYGGTTDAPAISEGDVLANEVMLSTDDIMKTFQQNNMNLLLFTQSLAEGKGTINKLLTSDSIYNSIAEAATSIREAASNTQVLFHSLELFASKLDDKGTIVNELVSDTLIFKTMKLSTMKLQNVADTMAIVISNLKGSLDDPKSPVGVLLKDEESGMALKAAITNLESSSLKLDQDLEALQHSFLLRKYFRKEEKNKQE